MEIFPVINCPTESCFRERFGLIGGLPFNGEKMAHIDASDGLFAKSETWVTPEEFKKISAETDIGFAVHLMYRDPEAVIGRWIDAGVKEVVIHVESIFDPERVADVCSRNGVKLALAANPNTPISELIPFGDRFSRFLLLAVNPGPAGQPMSSEVIPRIGELRAALPDATIEVDGGIVPETVRLIKQAGADIAVAGTYIFLGIDPAEAYLGLISAARE